jgi:plasmid maintenance system killer protein
MAIASFRSKPLGDLFMNGATRRIDKRLHRRRLLILDVMNRAESLADVASLPGFHPLAGDRRGHYAVTGIGNWPRPDSRVTSRQIGQSMGRRASMSSSKRP